MVKNFSIAIDDVSIPPPSAHGGDALALAGALQVPVHEILDLSMTMNPLAPDIVPLLRDVADSVRRYPDEKCATTALADAIGIESSRLLLTNGAAEGIALVANHVVHGHVVAPEFSLWQRHLPPQQVVTTDGAGRIRSNPNNPMGQLAHEYERAAVWDEAFYPLATGEWTRGDADHGSIVVGSLTKLYACPGLRLGFVLAPNAEAIEQLARRQPLWSVNSLALAVIAPLLELTSLRAWATQLRNLRSSLVSTLATYGLGASEGDAPWVLVTNAIGLRDALARRRILIRDCSNFGLADTVRIAVSDAYGIARLNGALADIFARRS